MIGILEGRTDHRAPAVVVVEEDVFLQVVMVSTDILRARMAMMVIITDQDGIPMTGILFVQDHRTMADILLGHL